MPTQTSCCVREKGLAPPRNPSMFRASFKL